MKYVVDPLSNGQKFALAVSKGNMALSRSEFANAIAALDASCPGDPGSGRLLAYLVRHSYLENEFLPTVVQLAKKWEGLSESKIPGCDRASVKLAQAIIHGIQSDYQSSQRLLEEASHLGYVRNELEVTAIAAFFMGKFRIEVGHCGAAVIHLRHSSALLETARLKAPSVDARILEAQAHLTLNNNLAARKILAELISAEVCNKLQKEHVNAILAQLMSRKKSSKRFSVAFSYPGEARDLAHPLANLLAKQFGRSRVLYDPFHIAEFARPNLDIYLQRLYSDHSDLIVVFASAAYAHKRWCGLEWRAIRELLASRDGNVLLLRLDDSDLPGIFSGDGFLDIRSCSTSCTARRILARWLYNGVYR